MRNNILVHEMVQKWFACYQIMSCELNVVGHCYMLFVAFSKYLFSFVIVSLLIRVLLFLFSISVATINGTLLFMEVIAILCALHIFPLSGPRGVWGSMQLYFMCDWMKTTDTKQTLSHTKQRSDSYQLETRYFFDARCK